MKQNKSLFAFCLLYMLFSTSISAQSFSSSGNSLNQSILLKSDYDTKSVLVSNLLADRVGDMSPVIGTAVWVDSGRQLQCRSLLKFDYKSLPNSVLNNPSLITSAELILFPLQVIFSESDLDKPSKFIVKRVLETWEDSSTLWLNQPAADPSSQVVKVIKKKQKNDPVRVDVTRLVTDMISSGNKGFMISQENSAEKSMALGQLFASPKNDDENLRPLLFIKYAESYKPNDGRQTTKLADEYIRQYDRMMQNQKAVNQSWNTVPVKTTEPVIITKPVIVKE